MIDYPTFHRLRQLRDEEHLSAAQIAAALGLDERTVGKWINVEKYQPRKVAKRPSKLDPFKSTIVRLLAQHPFTAQQLLQRLKEGGYTGGYSILKEFVQQVRPAAGPAFLTLHFAPGQSAQVDWGDAGVSAGGQTRGAGFRSSSWSSVTAAECMSSSPWPKPRNTSWPATSRPLNTSTALPLKSWSTTVKRPSCPIPWSTGRASSALSGFCPALRLRHQGLRPHKSPMKKAAWKNPFIT